MIDTHTHLYLEQFSEDITDVVNRAIDVGVTRCYLPSISSKHNNSMLELEKKFPGFFYSMIGLHPCYVNRDFENEILQVEKLIVERAPYSERKKIKVKSILSCRYVIGYGFI